MTERPFRNWFAVIHLFYWRLWLVDYGPNGARNPALPERENATFAMWASEHGIPFGRLAQPHVSSNQRVSHYRSAT